ncbi:hypothetical protein EVAR_67205_1 [Eumeta japonica]|uniref:Uncharacterized protein n=1 Tax=Eumeta variegata TaxID=151549 RepID=A0A4C2A8E6_EUMVA|nr:hypothetical protein EVAR_67205_1 [Eumeta japonica]
MSKHRATARPPASGQQGKCRFALTKPSNFAASICEIFVVMRCPHVSRWRARRVRSGRVGEGGAVAYRRLISRGACKPTPIKQCLPHKSTVKSHQFDTQYDKIVLFSLLHQFVSLYGSTVEAHRYYEKKYSQSTQQLLTSCSRLMCTLKMLQRVARRRSPQCETPSVFRNAVAAFYAQRYDFASTSAYLQIFRAAGPDSKRVTALAPSAMKHPWISLNWRI